MPQGKQINQYPESTSPDGDWYILVADSAGCYKKVKLSDLPGGGSTTSTTTLPPCICYKIENTDSVSATVSVNVCGGSPSIVTLDPSEVLYICNKTTSVPSSGNTLVIITFCGYACTESVTCDGCGEQTSWLEGNLFS